MTRRRIRSTAAMSLFPFLAVLICTMGSLIVLLVLLVQQARVQASVIKKVTDVEDKKKKEEQLRLQEAAEEQEWRQEVLEKQRVARLKQLNDEREKLSNLEDHLRELKAEWKNVQQELRALRTTKSKRSDQQLASESQLIRLAREIEQAKKTLDEARKELSGKPKSFAIVPYRGPNGTTQRPIYLECLEDAAYIRPEGIRIPLSYLEGPLGAGNPLEAALRTVRDYWKKNGIVNRATDPYPLIIVRPGGEWTYSRVREAMKSWEDQFGYELIPEKMKLEFPPADGQLAKMLQTEIREAHRRQQILKRMRPKSFRGTVGGGGRGGARRSGGGRFQFGGGGYRGSSSARSKGGRVAMGNGGGFGGGPSVRERRNGSFGSGGSGQQRSEQKGSNKPGQENSRNKGQGSANGMVRKPGGQQGGQSASGGGNMPRSLAKANGKNWAIPNYKPRAAAFVRDIRVGVLKDQLVIFPDKGFKGKTKIYPIRGNSRSAIEEFVHSDIWDHVKSWGIAAAGGYWKPVLQVKVGPGGEQRFKELKALLQDSGLEIRRK